VTAEQVDAIVRELSLLLAIQEPGMAPADLDGESYIFGYRSGARQALSDAVCRLRDMRPALSNVTRIGATR
jgi:hypothetical protein